MNKYLLGGILLLLMGGGIYGHFSCKSTGGIKQIEEMTDLEYSKWKLYIQLGTKIGANRLLESGSVTHEELDIAANIVTMVKDQPVTAGVTSLISPALEKAGFKNEEVQLVLLIAEQELLARGALEWLNPETGGFELSPRSKELLDIVADALRTAGTVTTVEAQKAQEMKADFSTLSK